MGVVAKMFISTATTGPDGSTQYQLGVVCRGEENKDWAAATPSGGATLVGAALDEVWAAKLAGEITAAEVLVYQHPDPDGDFEMRSCDFTYNGCLVKFYRTANSQPYGLKLEMTVNAKPASEQLRKAYAEGLLSGQAPRFRIDVARATDS